MSASPAILVATESVADAALVTKQLGEEFDGVFVSADPKRAVQDFERHRPAVLILAFDSLEKCERYYLGLYRLSTAIHGIPHRTLILCNREDVRRVYDLCKQEYFDDYILYWPATNDTLRLPMAVHHALRQLASVSPDVPSAREIAAQARRLSELESQLARYSANGGQRMEVASESLKKAEQEIGAVLDGFSRKLAEGGHAGLVEVKDRAGLEKEFNRLKTDEIGTRFQSMAVAVQPIRQWLGGLSEAVAPQLESARALQSMVERVRPVVLVVDDDDFQRKLMARMLADTDLDCMFAGSGTEALASLRKRRPDLVLMDVDLPDFDGVETTRRIKAVDAFAAIPVIMITGHSGKEVVVKSLKAGAVDFVVKPFDRDIVIAKLRKLLNLAPAAGG